MRAIRDYFVSLCDASKAFLNELPIELEPQPLNYCLNRLAPAITSRRGTETERWCRLTRPKPDLAPGTPVPTGLNTVGMLTDRLTILLIKEWCLRHKGTRDSTKADDLFRIQTTDMIEALALAQRGSSSLNAKITNIRGDASATTWEEAYFGLLGTNLILWESQEVLYIKDIGSLPAEELRDYIRWFSFGNIRRNEYIQLCDELYWTH